MNQTRTQILEAGSIFFLSRAAVQPGAPRGLTEAERRDFKET
ncbi:MAG TPA: hypothetical protein V6D17_22450 [Candidatus Obscuribacterales bacterium]